MTQALQDTVSAAVESGALPHLCGLVLRGGEIVYEGAAGDAGLDRIYRIASMTKALTSVAVMQCVERGLIELDASLDRYLALPSPRVLVNVDAHGQGTFRDAIRTPTIRELLTHTGGYGYGVWNERLCHYFKARELPALGPSGAERLTAPMVADPGTEWHYGIATDFLGQIVEAVTSTDLETYMQTNIFKPLGMPDSSFTLAPANDDRLMPPYHRGPNGELVTLELPRPQANGFCSGGGGLTSTPRDYARFLGAILNKGTLEGTRILKANTVESMLTNHTGDMPIPGMRSHDPAVSESHEFFPGVPKAWGLGFLINLEPIPGMRGAGTGTWAGLFNTHFWIDPAANLAGLLMTQLLPFCDPAFMETYARFEAAAYDD